MNNKQSTDAYWSVGPLEIRLPFYHLRMVWPDFIQGNVVNMATSLALVPLLLSEFGLNFEQAVACVMLHHVLICLSFLVFGLPMAPGWITPAIPVLLLTVFGSFVDASERFQMMTAVSIDFAVLMLVIGLTGIGQRLMLWIPRSLKSGIILGAAIAAFQRVFVDDIETLSSETISTTVALALSLMLLFSRSVSQWRKNHKVVAYIASLGLLPALVVGGVVGAITGELTFAVQGGIFLPDFMGFFEKATPFFIGWPSYEMYLQGLPLALMTYVILFGDILIGDEIIKAAAPHRPDTNLSVNVDKAHTSIGIRNFLMAISSPFFGSQGALWTGVHVLLVQEWSSGGDKRRSLMSSISSYYSFGIPWFFYLMPVISLLEPMMNIGLALTMILTGFVCAYVAMDIPRNDEERGVAVMTAIAMVVFPPWVGLLIGLSSCYLIAYKGKCNVVKSGVEMESEQRV